MSDLVGNPEDRFSHNGTQIMQALSQENLSLGSPTRSNTNPAVQPQKMGRGLKFQIQEVEKLYYMYVVKTKALISCIVNAQLICPFIFVCAIGTFSHDVAQIIQKCPTYLHAYAIY